MPKPKEKILLTGDLIDELVAYYRFSLTAEDRAKLVEWECFSHPSLELHECNARVLLPGKRKCTYCSNKVDKSCDISCDIQTFCLAAYFFRLDGSAKQKDLKEHISNSLNNMKPDELYSQVIDALAGVISKKDVKEIKDAEKGDVLKIKPPVPVKEDTEGMLTLNEVAEIKECRYSAVHAATKDGRLPSREVNGKLMVAKSDLGKYTPRKSKKKEA